MKNRFLLLLTVFVLVLGLLCGCTASGGGNMSRGGSVGPAGGAEQGGNTGGGAAGASNASAAASITQEQAKQIALEHVGLTAGQVTGLRVRYDMDDGIPEYDVEFYYDTFEHEFEIHAETGKILNYEKDD